MVGLVSKQGNQTGDIALAVVARSGANGRYEPHYLHVIAGTAKQSIFPLAALWIASLRSQ